MVNDKGEFVGKFLKYMLDAAPKEFLTTDTLYTIIAGKVVYQNQNPNP